jgi:hypothetical protein
MSNSPTLTENTLSTISNQVSALRLIAQGLPTQPLEMLVQLMQFMLNDVVNHLAQGGSLADCSALTDRFARYETLRQRAVNTSLREAKARQKAAAEMSPQETPAPTARNAEAEPPVTSPAVTPPLSSPRPASRLMHMSRQQRRALLRKLTQVATSVAPATGVGNPS